MSCWELTGPHLQLQAPGPEAELRVLFTNAEHPLAIRLPDAVYVSGRHQPLELRHESVEVILYTDWHYSHVPVLVRRPWGEGQLACTTLTRFEHPVIQQIFYRLIRDMSGCFAASKPLEVGILGFAPSVGKLHGTGVQGTPGLRLRAACDLNPQRLEQARQDFPGLKTVDSAEELAEDPETDLVFVATSPNTHASLSIQMLAAGKHVICEKPLALNRNETMEMVAEAQRTGRHLSCHQNRRWDVDYLAIKQALGEGLIGRLFYLETFVGGFHHPCGYWHSHAPVSGGTTYDWGAHYLDWIVSLMPGRIHSLIGMRHKRVWHDVTNADQERILLLYEDGREAEFIHSDIAAAPKPKWYLLGTEGAIVGNWQDVSAYDIDPLLYYHRHDIPATEMTPEIKVMRRHPGGQIVSLNPPLPERKHFAFHRNLADHLLIGEPIAAPLEDSVRVVAILEMAARSMQKGGSEEKFDG